MRPLDYLNPDTKAAIISWPDKQRARVLEQLRELQNGGWGLRCKPWKGNGWRGFEIRISAMRVVGTLEDPTAVVVLHAFLKDAAEGRETRRQHVKLIEKRHSDWKNRRKQNVH